MLHGVDRDERGGAEQQWCAAADTESRRLPHLDLLDAVGQRPIEVVEQPDEGELHAGEPVVEARAHPPTRPKGQELVAAAGEVPGAVLEPLRLELVGVLPVPRVAADGPCVDDDA